MHTHEKAFDNFKSLSAIVGFNCGRFQALKGARDNFLYLQNTKKSALVKVMFNKAYKPDGKCAKVTVLSAIEKKSIKYSRKE